MYTDDDCVASIQLAAWIYGKRENELTTTEYKTTGFSPTLPTLLRRFDDWDTATLRAESNPQIVPSGKSTYYQAIATIRRLHDLTGHPVTKFDYQRLESELNIKYKTLISVGGSWTHMKRLSGVHASNSDRRWGERSYYTSDS